jgi:F-type H+-transporting ATPase subunit epsilon
MENISLKIITPSKVVIKDTLVNKVIIPAYLGDMTILKDRAPSSVLLRDGVLQILDANNNPVDKYFVKGGIADIAQDKCIIASEEIIPVEGVTVLSMKPRLVTALKRDKPFYQMILRHIFLRRLTRTRTRTEFSRVRSKKGGDFQMLSEGETKNR